MTTPTVQTFDEMIASRDIQIIGVSRKGRDATIVRHEYGYGGDRGGKFEIWRTYPSLAAGQADQHGEHPLAVRHVTERWEKLMGATTQWWRMTSEHRSTWSNCSIHECSHGCSGMNLAKDRR